jgi:predicted amidohydrolase
VLVACVQLELVLGDPAGNRVRAQDAIAACVRHGASIIVLPELCSTGYRLTVEELRAGCENADGPTTRAWAEAIGGGDAVVVGGFAERAVSGRPYNAAAVVDRNGCRAVYRKIHLWDRERDLFRTGEAPPPVVDLDGVRIGVQICHDVWYPEVARRLAVDGADVLAVPTNWPRSDAPGGARTDGARLCEVAALVNRVFVAAADRVGVERSLEFAGASVIAGPAGRPLAGPLDGRPGTIYAACDLAAARDKHWSPRNHMFKDRRPELY